MTDYTDSAMTVIEALTKLASNFGPFLFAILFIMFITRSANKSYRETVTRADPQATDGEIKTQKFYFQSCSVFGFALVVVAICWWIYSQTRPQVYQFVIQNLKEHQYVRIENAVNTYSKPVPLEPVFPDGPRTRDHHFAIIPSSPMQVGQVIRIQFWETSPETASGGLRPQFPVVKSFQVKYAGNHIDTFRYDPDKPDLVGE